MDNPHESPLNQELLGFFKALSDPERLKIIGLLALEPHSTLQIAGKLGIKPTGAARQLETLQQAGLVLQADSAYRLDTQALADRSRRVLSGLRPQVTADDFEGEAYDRKVLSDFMQADGRLKSIPTQEKKIMAVLRYLAQAFEPGVHCSEKEVNGRLMRYYHDTAFLRRYLVDNGFLERSQDGRDYWRPES
ncbi:MAG: DUF2087 domain-containing protein [Anaerolineales bacterium]